MSKHKYNHDLAQRDDFVVRFSCEANWDRFADERNDPELAEVVTKAVKAELKKRADKEPATQPTPVVTPEPAPVQPEPTQPEPQDDDANAVEFAEPTEGQPTP